MSAVPDTTTAAPQGPNFFQKNKIWFIVIGLFLVSNFSVYFYQRYQHHKLMQTCRAALDTNYKTAQEMTLLRSEEAANNLCRTMVFGIRGEMERGNKADIDLFLNRMVQESGLDLVIIQNAQDSIYLSTDKKYENQRVPYIQGVITAQQVLKSDLAEVVIAAPIMGTEQRLGTLLIVYKAPSAVDVLMERMQQDSLPGEVREKAK
jgi:hypothetical protein